jgi:D-3-phosphoglycerate dehydrogenase
MVAAMTDRPLVVITDPIHPKAVAQLREQCDVLIASEQAPRSLRQLMSGAHGLIVRSQLPSDVFDDAPVLRAVVRHGVGVDMIPMQAASLRRIPVANLPGSNTTAVVEYCVAAMMHLRRRLPEIDSTLRTSGWDAARPIANRIGEVAGGVCGIVGVGAIGTRLATVCAGLGMQVLGLTRRPHGLPAGVRAASKQELFETSDAVMLCCPLNEQTRGLVDTQAIAAMKKSAILVNVARGPVVDTTALLAALREGRIAGAALDVHQVQPIPAGDPLFEVPNLLLTPHVAGITNASLRAMSLGAAQAMLALLRGERWPNIVNPQVFD